MRMKNAQSKARAKVQLKKKRGDFIHYSTIAGRRVKFIGTFGKIPRVP